MLWDATPREVFKNRPIFIDLARKATARRPDIPNNWERLAFLLLETGEHEEAIAVLAEAASAFPKAAKLHLMLADAYDRAHRLDLAHEVLHLTAVIPINDRTTTIYRLELLMQTQAVKDTAQIAIDTLGLDPTNTTALRVLGKVSRKEGNPEIMLPFCQVALTHDPGHCQARYELAFAFTILERSEEALQLIDLDRFVTVTHLVAPEGYGNAAAFEAAIADEVTRNTTLRPDPSHLAIRGGLQTLAGLPHAGERAISDVITQIRSAVDVFEANLTEELDHPFINSRPKRASVNAWAVVYSGGSRQVAHIHPDSWLSGVYYVSTPKPSCEEPRNGCLVLGALEIEGVNVAPPWGVRDINPAPGRLVLFPSYVPHATIPTRSNDRRICIAFDVEASPT
jgi:uncharacterized protein (TIGR02466 family)